MSIPREFSTGEEKSRKVEISTLPASFTTSYTDNAKFGKSESTMVVVVMIATVVGIAVPMTFVEVMNFAAPFPVFGYPAIARSAFDEMATAPNILAVEKFPEAWCPYIAGRRDWNDLDPSCRWWHANFNANAHLGKCRSGGTARYQQCPDQSNSLEWREEPIR
jgi:hypothetical protein